MAEADEDLPAFRAQEGYAFYARWEVSDPEGLDCVSYGHMWVENTEPGAFKTSDGKVPRAGWCLWCGTAVSNMDIGDDI